MTVLTSSKLISLFVFAVNSSIKMWKILLMFSVFLAYFNSATSAKDLSNEFQWRTKKYSIDEQHLLEREDKSDFKNVHKANLIQGNMSRSTPRDYHTGKLSGSAHITLNPEMPQVREVKAERKLIINSARETSGKSRVKRNTAKNPVHDLKAVVVNSSSIVLSWERPEGVSLDNIQAYNVSWTCPGCYYSQRSGSHLVLKGTTYRLNNLQRDQTYTFYVRVETTYGPGKYSNTTATISRYFDQVRNLRQGFTNNTLTLQWDKPSDVDAGDVQYYSVRWCETTKNRYCYPLNSTNVTQTEFKIKLFYGYTYTFYVRAVTAYGQGKETNIQVWVPPLNYKVYYVHGHLEGRYGLQVHLYWYRYGIPSSINQFEVRWHCISGRAYCYWNDRYSSWQNQIVSTTSAYLNMTRYNTAYLFEVLVVTPEGKGKPTQYYLTTGEFSGMPANFTCEVTSSNYNLMCHWTPPSDVNPVGFYHYHFRYRCDDCLYSPIQYRTIYNFNQTSINVTVTKGARYTAWINVYTRYGTGKTAQTTTSTKSSLGPVTQLNATVDRKVQNLVKITWNPPSGSSGIWFYVVIIECPTCGQFNTIRSQVINKTSYSQKLKCGQTYVITVRAATHQETSADKQVNITIDAAVEAVNNLAVRFIAGNRNGSAINPNGSYIEQSSDKFQLTWSPPKKLSPFSIEGYEIVVMRENNTKVFSVETKTTELQIICQRDGLESGHNFFFYARVKALCGFGKESIGSGYYPLNAFPLPPTRPQSSVATSSLSSSRSRVISTTGSITSATQPSTTMTSPTKLFTSSPLTRKEKHNHFPYWTIPTAILGVIVVMIVVFVVYKSRQGRCTFCVEFYHQVSTKDTPEGNEMPVLLESLTDDELLITA